jgi:triacylglycerol lipase
MSTAPKVVQDHGEVPLVLRSNVREPLSQLSFLRRSLVFAELALIAYNDEAEAQRGGGHDWISGGAAGRP